ncbi:MAG TPA: type II toxin-antitoxin system VapC family toxin [Acetobacteraceae bacterium]|nr:type II toxin-antitoxin system VapC family toxin [Acetobacteraceae bacterium]
MIVIDTNVLSELAKPAAEPTVVAWANAQPIEDLYTTATTEAEMLFGLACVPAGRRQDSLRRAIETAFSVLLAGRVLSFDRPAARAYAELAVERRRQGRAANGPDLQIAAIARSRGASAIATRNTRDFEGCGMPLINPWLVGTTPRE